KFANSPMLDLVKAIEDKLEKLNEQLTDPKVISDNQRFKTLSREHKDLTEIVTVGREYRKLLQTIEDSDKLLASESDTEMLELATQEKTEATGKLEGVARRLKLLLSPRDPNDAKDVILEIRAGT